MKKMPRYAGLILVNVAFFALGSCMQGSGALEHLRVQLSKNTIIFSSPRRIAYVVTLNISSPRYLQTKNVLENFGFVVRNVAPQFIGKSTREQTLSNKFALLQAVRFIKDGDDPWGYAFEDDLADHELSSWKISDLVKIEGQSDYFMYLGICMGSPPKNSIGCGRCAHAMGFSKKGATEVASFASQTYPLLETGRVPREEEYFDVINEAWCKEKGGFRIIGPLRKSARGHDGHYGIFIQDRAKFRSQIDAGGK